MSTASVIAATKRRWVPAILLVLFAGTSLGVSSGATKEHAGYLMSSGLMLDNRN